jgi:hypothetical protein
LRLGWLPWRSRSLRLVSLAAKTVRAYDSGGFSNAATILQELRHHIQDVHLFRASDEECASQRDTSSCGDIVLQDEVLFRRCLVVLMNGLIMMRYGRWWLERADIS